MKKLSTYLVSLLLSVVFVFVIIATATTVIIKINVTKNRSIQLSEDVNVYSSIMEELQKYFNNQYNTTGISADVYMNAIDEDYIHTITNSYTDALFSSLKSGEQVTVEIPKNENLESNIESFFSDYADSNGYQKDDVYDKKVSSTIKNAYSVIESYCDVYKYLSLQKHGVFSKISGLYSSIGKIMIICIIALVFLAVLLILFNIKELSSVLYWTGISSLIAGILGTVPSAYFLAVNYFDSFVIKQQQVFRTFTGAMYGLTRAFIAVHISIMVIGIFFIVIYTVFNRLHKKSEQ